MGEKEIWLPPLCQSNHDASKQEQAETSTHEISELTFCVQLQQEIIASKAYLKLL